MSEERVPDREVRRRTRREKLIIHVIFPRPALKGLLHVITTWAILLGAAGIIVFVSPWWGLIGGLAAMLEGVSVGNARRGLRTRYVASVENGTCWWRNRRADTAVLLTALTYKEACALGDSRLAAALYDSDGDTLRCVHGWFSRSWEEATQASNYREALNQLDTGLVLATYDSLYGVAIESCDVDKLFDLALANSDREGGAHEYRNTVAVGLVALAKAVRGANGDPGQCRRLAEHVARSAASVGYNEKPQIVLAQYEHIAKTLARAGR